MKNVALGLVDVINILRPEVVVIGGGVSNQGEGMLNPIKDYVYKHVYGKDSSARSDIRVAKLGNDAGTIGAAFLGK